jgi:hypothetical protein
MGQKINLVMDQGATFTVTFNIIDSFNNPVDLSSYTPVAAMKKSYYSINSYSFSANCYSNGAIVMSMNAATSGSVQDGRYVYDIDVSDTLGNVSRLIEGMVVVTPGVSIT